MPLKTALIYLHAVQLICNMTLTDIYWVKFIYDDCKKL